ncbi:MAG: hypothetical protein ACI9MC_001947 [Kiritimatiellia bacterium]|jgi:hypothetical protein
MRGILLALLLGSPALAARTTAPPSVQQLAQESTGVLRGNVTSAVTSVDRGQVITTYQVDKHAIVAGLAPESIEVRLPGGQIGDRVVTTFGVPVWSVGDSVIVFLDGARPVSLSAVFTVRDAQVIDPWRRPLSDAPERLQAFVGTVLDARLPAPDVTGTRPER